MAVTVRRLTTADQDPATAVLARAFLDYPLMALIAPEPATRLPVVMAIMRFSCIVRTGLDYPLLGAFREGTLAGVAGLTPPVEIDWTDEVKAAYEAAGRAMGPEGTAILEAYSGLAESFKPAAEPVWYLGVIGVDPGHQGAGVGSALLTAIDQLVDADTSCAGIYLDTETASNVALYQHRGYHVLGETTYRGMPIWGMLRRREPLDAVQIASLAL